MEIEAGFPVVKKLPSGSEVKASEIPASNLVTCIYFGPYGDEMRSAYEALYKQAEEKGYVPTGVFYEIYYNSPVDTPPEKLQTKIVFTLNDN